MKQTQADFAKSSASLAHKSRKHHAATSKDLSTLGGGEAASDFKKAIKNENQEGALENKLSKLENVGKQFEKENQVANNFLTKKTKTAVKAEPTSKAMQKMFTAAKAEKLEKKEDKPNEEPSIEATV